MEYYWFGWLVLALCALACIAWAGYRRVAKIRVPEADSARESPELVVEYGFTGKTGSDPAQPLIVKNISRYTAYNVEVLPLKTEYGEARFEPSLIPYIEAHGQQQVLAVTLEGSPIFRADLPRFLHGGFPREDWGEKLFTLSVRYNSSTLTKFQVDFEITFKAHRCQTYVGRMKRRLVRT